MVRFEIKKFIKSKNFFFLLLFSLIISLYCFFSNEKSLILYEYDNFSGAFFSVDDFFSGEPAPSELKNLETNRRVIESNSGQNLSKKAQKKLQYEEDKWRLNLLNNYKKKYPQPFNSDNIDNIGNLKWSIFKYEYNNKYDTYDVYARNNLRGDNLLQRVLLSSNKLFGVIPIIFLTLLFSGIFSKERENHTINLLYSQPISRKKIVFSKFILIIVSILTYIILVMASYYILSLLSGIKISGDRDLYRILSNKNFLSYYTGFSLLMYVFISFFAVALFWTSLTLFFSSRLNSQTVVSVMLVIIALIYATTPYFSFMKNIFNPLYNLDIVFRLLGNYELVTNEAGQNSFKLLEATSPIYYLTFILASLLLLLASLNAKAEVKSHRSKEKVRNFTSLFQFEAIKIFNTNSYKIYLLGFVFLIITNFAVKVNLDNKVEKESFSDMGYFKSQYIMGVDFLKKEVKRLENILNGKDKLIYYDFELGKPVVAEKLDKADKERLSGQINQLQEEITSVESKMEVVDDLNESYRIGDGQKYYGILSDLLYDNWEANVDSSKILDYSHSIELNKKVFERASKDNTRPLTIVDPLYSPLDKYKDIETNKEISGEMNIYEHSGPILLFDLVKNDRLGLILLVLVSIMVISGFTIDTENGRQVEFIFTSSYTRSKIYRAKILSQFVYSCLTIIGLLTFIFILGFLADGTKGYDFPIANYQAGTFNLIPLWLYLLKSVILLLSLTFFMTCLMNLLSIYIKNKLSLLSITILFLAIGNYVSNILPGQLRAYSPLSYFNIETVSDQSIKIYKNLTGASYTLALITIISWSVLFLLMGHICLSKKKDIL